MMLRGVEQMSVGSGMSIDDGEGQLVEVTAVVRRVLRARSSDPHLVVDLAQETLVRVASAQHRLLPDELQPYAITTAQNVYINHCRRRSVELRHVHRLVDYTSLAGPEQLLLERDETNAPRWRWSASMTTIELCC